MRQAPTPAHASTARRLHARAPTPAVPVRRAQEGEEAQVGQEGEEEQEKQEEQEEQGQRLRLGLTRGLLSRSLHGHSLTRRRRHVACTALGTGRSLSSSVHFGCHVKREFSLARCLSALCYPTLCAASAPILARARSTLATRSTLLSFPP